MTSFVFKIENCDAFRKYVKDNEITNIDYVKALAIVWGSGD